MVRKADLHANSRCFTAATRPPITHACAHVGHPSVASFHHKRENHKHIVFEASEFLVCVKMSERPNPATFFTARQFATTDEPAGAARILCNGKYLRFDETWQQIWQHVYACKSPLWRGLASSISNSHARFLYKPGTKEPH